MKIRPYIAGDESGILKLRRCVFGVQDPFKLKRDTWQWEFLENPEGRALIIVAEEKDKIIGHYGLLPTRISYYGKDILVGLAVDLMVHPGFRRKGLFLKLFERVVEEAKKYNFNAIWGFPNRIALPVYTNKLGWYHVKTLKIYVMVNLKVFFKRCAQGEFSCDQPKFDYYRKNNIEFAKIDNFNDSYNFWKYNLSHLILKERTPSYLNWRYIAPYWYNYKVYSISINGDTKGFFVLRFMEYKGFEVGFLMDIFPLPLLYPKIFKDVIRAIGSMCFSVGAKLFIFGDPMSLIPPISSFIHLPDPFSPRPWYVGWKALSPFFVPRAKDFYVTFGDGDII